MIIVIPRMDGNCKSLSEYGVSDDATVKELAVYSTPCCVLCSLYRSVINSPGVVG
jgi:hypothetical protein